MIKNVKSNSIIFKLFIVLAFSLVSPCCYVMAMPTQRVLQNTNDYTCKIKVLKYTGEPQTEVYAKLFGNTKIFEADENGVITLEYNSDYIHSVNIYFKNEKDTYKKTISLNTETSEMSVYFERLQDIMEYKRTARLFHIEGIVLDDRGNTLECATVSIQGTKRRTLTDEYGFFELEGDFNHFVNFRADGMDNKSLPLTYFFTEKEVNVSMYRKNSWSVYGSAEKMPEFPGGMQAFQNYLNKNLVYPAKALKKKIEGVVVVQFIVETDGSIAEPRIARHLEESLDTVAWNLIKDMPKWTPASDFGSKVRCKYSLPVAFKIPKPKSTEPVPLINHLGVDSMAQHRLAMMNIKPDSIGSESLYLDSLAKMSMKTESSLYDKWMQYKPTASGADMIQPGVKEKKRNAFVRFFRWLFGIERRQRKRAEKESLLKVQNDSVNVTDSLKQVLPNVSLKMSDDNIRIDVDSLDVNVKQLEKATKELVK